MIIDLAKPTQAGTFELPGGGTVSLRLLSADDLKAIRKECSRTVVDYPLLGGQYRRFEHTEFDSDKWDILHWDRAITGWTDLFDKNGQPIPVTSENKVLLMERVAVFQKAVNDGLEALRKADAEATEEAAKNS